MLQLQILPQALTVCKVEGLGGFALSGLFFIGSTDNELSLVCETDRTPANTTAREDGAGVGIFAVSTYDTDYILVKAENLDRAAAALNKAGYALQGIPAEL